jgi:hypothetical protein
MSKIIQIAERLRKSPATVYKMIDGSREAKPEEKAILTDALGPDAGKACDWEALNGALRADNQRLALSNIDLTAENARHVRGHKVNLLANISFCVAVVGLVLIIYAPRWFQVKLKEAQTNQALEARVTLLERALSHDDTLIDRYEAVLDKMEAVEIISEDQHRALIEAITETK